MTTYADYSHQIMAPEDNTDFPLFPYQDIWNQEQAYLPTTTFADQTYLQATTYDSFTAQTAYAQLNQGSFPYDSAALSNPIKDALHAPSPGYSPTNSASHSFDYQNPPVLSSTSDSGASVQSTISSGMNSPSMHPQQSHDWSQQATMASAPSIHDSLGQGVFAMPNFDYESLPVSGKDCVGELTNISSAQMSHSVAAFSSSHFPFYLANDRAGMIDSTAQHPMFRQADVANSSKSMEIAFAPWSQRGTEADITSPNDSVFRSPLTPASATATSPVLERVKGRRQTSTITPHAHKRARGASPLSTTVSIDSDEILPCPHAPPPTLSSPFFYQSSGHFVPPLELSYPSLIQPTFSPTHFSGAQFPEMAAVQSLEQMQYPPPQSQSPADFKRVGASPRSSTGKAQSPYVAPHKWQPYPAYPTSRRQSVTSVHSRHSQGSISSGDDTNKGLCPITSCGRQVKDLKAHMLTHQNERPEKCPIPTCEYHIKGFARKYDKNRHTLTHYKGTMVCGFCPGSGSAAEKSFNRADVFKRHLTSVHGVEQTPPNARKKSPSSSSSKKPAYGLHESSGMCSTCGITFASAQDFYEHLDDCVLRVVQQAEPSEAINEKLLSSVAEDQEVQETMERHSLPTDVDSIGPTSFDDEEVEEDEEDEEDTQDGTYGTRSAKIGKGVSAQHVGGGNHLTMSGAIGRPKGLTRSKNGVPLSGPMSGKGNKRRKNYPLSWGAAAEKMKMKKRVLCVYDGQRRLWKDDMMLDADHEVRIPLPGAGDGRAWVTDLDVQTVARAEGVLNATEEEKGPWIPEDELERLMA
ncbi:hypothetical protein LTR86_002087 [Recurvomyces mirabilis]|nr:hypothetical protein LTR86_002087 [Recurvomyces mirabilis]